MTSTDWAILMGTGAVLIVPTIMAWIALWTRLGILVFKIDGSVAANEKLSVEIRELWRVHNHQEGRLFMQDRVIALMIDKLDLDLHEVDFSPKAKPHYHGDPERGL